MASVVKRRNVKGAEEPKRITRIKVLCDNQEQLIEASTLRFSGDSVLITCGTQLPIGTKVTIMPVGFAMDEDFLELEGTVIRTYENVLESAFAENRFLMGVELKLNADTRSVIRKICEDVGETMVIDRNGSHVDDNAHLDSAVWRIR
ncbi:MAG: hypothetical protein CMH54_12140 [Myxococcales bacterium]|nr:hypothetical protein [Myxococcales bacterium]